MRDLISLERLRRVKHLMNVDLLRKKLITDTRTTSQQQTSINRKRSPRGEKKVGIGESLLDEKKSYSSLMKLKQLYTRNTLHYRTDN